MMGNDLSFSGQSFDLFLFTLFLAAPASFDKFALFEMFRTSRGLGEWKLKQLNENFMPELRT